MRYSHDLILKVHTHTHRRAEARLRIFILYSMSRFQSLAFLWAQDLHRVPFVVPFRISTSVFAIRRIIRKTMLGQKSTARDEQRCSVLGQFAHLRRGVLCPHAHKVSELHTQRMLIDVRPLLPQT